MKHIFTFFETDKFYRITNDVQGRDFCLLPLPISVVQLDIVPRIIILKSRGRFNTTDNLRSRYFRLCDTNSRKMSIPYFGCALVFRNLELFSLTVSL